MREIKFRGWHKYLQCMYAIKKLSFSVDGNLVAYLAYEGKAFTENELDIMQYTGLKDKNGKEIYEGDIISFDEYHKKVIKFDSYHDLECSFTGYDLSKEEAKKCEVIGNKYKSPELLKQ